MSSDGNPPSVASAPHTAEWLRRRLRLRAGTSRPRSASPKRGKPAMGDSALPAVTGAWPFLPPSGRLEARGRTLARCQVAITVHPTDHARPTPYAHTTTERWDEADGHPLDRWSKANVDGKDHMRCARDVCLHPTRSSTKAASRNLDPVFSRPLRSGTWRRAGSAGRRGAWRVPGERVAVESKAWQRMEGKLSNDRCD